MPLRVHRLRLVQLFFVLVAVTALGAAWAGTASAAPTGAVASHAAPGEAASIAASWPQAAAFAVVLPPPHDPSRGSCTASRIGAQIRLDCLIQKPDTTLWVACSGGFVEIRHLPVGGITAQGTCPQYGGYALTATSNP
ncbi:hypothetical protein ACFP2T_08790 [Plantactinospora solaniradicis]|uniref:Uncharacterized protein n=1 Tax=Plantactinospora solaniradicis TaxID=1723736 RepID=A0ABW1K679_9ACTN